MMVLIILVSCVVIARLTFICCSLWGSHIVYRNIRQQPRRFQVLSDTVTDQCFHYASSTFSFSFPGLFMFVWTFFCDTFSDFYGRNVSNNERNVKRTFKWNQALKIPHGKEEEEKKEKRVGRAGVSSKTLWKIMTESAVVRKLKEIIVAQIHHRHACAFKC